MICSARPAAGSDGVSPADRRAAAHIRRWLAETRAGGHRSQFSWPTDGLSTEQHARYVAHRNAHYDALRAGGRALYYRFVEDYALALEQGTPPPGPANA